MAFGFGDTHTCHLLVFELAQGEGEDDGGLDDDGAEDLEDAPSEVDDDGTDNPKKEVPSDEERDRNTLLTPVPG